MKLVKYKHLSVNSKTKKEKKRERNKKTRRQNKKIKFSINKPKCISCHKCFTKLQKMKNVQSKIKPIKTGKELRTTNCLGCKDFTHNFRHQEVKMTKCLEKNLTVLFVGQINQDFYNKSTTTKNNLTLY